MKKGMQKPEVGMEKSVRTVPPTLGRDGVPRRPRPRSSGRNQRAHDVKTRASVLECAGPPALFDADADLNAPNNTRVTGRARHSVRAANQPRRTSRVNTRDGILPLLPKGGEGRGEESIKVAEGTSDAAVFKAKTPHPSPLPAWAGRWRRTAAVPVYYTLPKSILEKIWLERLRQKQLLRAGRIFFACDSPVVSHDRKLRVLTEELGEIARAIDRIENFDPLRRPRAELSQDSTRARNHLHDELTQLAAVAIAWLESLQARPRSAGVPPASSGGVSPPEATRAQTRPPTQPLP
jgi:hypothetical protein